MNTFARVEAPARPFATSLRVVRWSLALVCAGIAALVGVVFLHEWCDPSGSPYPLLAGNYEGDWVLTEHSRAQHPELVRGHERLRLRIAEPLQSLDEEGYRTRMPQKPFDVARATVAWNDVEVPCLVRVQDPWPLPRVIYAADHPFGRVGYGDNFAIAMDSSSSPAREYLSATLGEGMSLSYRRAHVPWYWRAFEWLSRAVI